MALLGTRDPRLNQHGRIDLRLSRQLRSYSRVDPPSTRVKPIPIGLLQIAISNTEASANPTPLIAACTDMTIIAFYFLMRPGEYAVTNAESHPFRLADVEMYQGAMRLDLTATPLPDLHHATFAILVFTTQKNSVRGEKIGHACSGHPFFCPVRAIARRVQHLRQHGAPTDSPLHRHYSAQGRATPLSTRAVAAFLKRFVATHGRDYGLRPNDIEARSLRASGAMALLCARVDPDVIRLVGRWRSDAMLRYLHVQAAPVMSPLAGQMFQGGDFTFNPLDPDPQGAPQPGAP